MIKLKSLLTESKGDCYVAAGRLIMDFMGNASARLVHGMVNGQGALQGLRFGHAWVEVGSKVYDYSNDRNIRMGKGKYYAAGDIKPKDNRYYLPKKALRWMQKSMHWGPWQMSGDAVKLRNEDIPDVRGEIGRRKQRIPNDILDKLND